MNFLWPVFSLYRAEKVSHVLNPTPCERSSQNQLFLTGRQLFVWLMNYITINNHASLLALLVSEYTAIINTEYNKTDVQSGLH